MAILNTEKEYRLIDDCVTIKDKLPVKTYNFKAVKTMMGVDLLLEEINPIEIREKIYGTQQSKVDKIFNSFKEFDRNLGVILSGNKGIGKSICAKMIAQQALKHNLPVIIINEYTKGISNFINGFKQECVVIFDEFDKTFGSATHHNNNNYDEGPREVVERGGPSADKAMNDAQTELLTLFDGVMQGKKLFIITCNDITSISSFLVNRPGRFHYHLRFEYPTPEEIREYLQDKLNKQYWNQIQEVVAFSKKLDLNYDCLRAIAFELNTGLKFADAIKDLNIINNKDSYNRYVYRIELENGEIISGDREGIYIDLFSDNELDLYFHTGEMRGRYNLNAMDIQINPTTWENSIDGKNVRVNYVESMKEMTDVERKAKKEQFYHVKRITFKRKYTPLHYMI